MTQTIDPSWYNPPQPPKPKRTRQSPRTHPISITAAKEDRRCWDCGRAAPDVRGALPRCPEHRLAWDAARRQRYHARVAVGLCGECGLRPGAPSRLDPEDAHLRYALCAVCATRHGRYVAATGAQQRYHDAKAAGKCTVCRVRLAAPGRTRCVDCAERQRQRQRLRKRVG